MPTMLSKRSKTKLQPKKTSNTLLKKRSFFGVLVLTSVLLFSLPASSAGAVGSSVEVNVNNQTALVFITSVNTSELNSSTNTVQTSSPTVRLRGPVNKLLQLRIYVDTTYVSTVPLTPTMTEFEHDIEVTPGSHTIEVEGISANSSPNPRYSFTLIYTPTINTPGTTIPPTQPTPDTDEGVIIDSTGTVAPVGSPSEVSIQLPSWLFNALVTLDIASPTATGTSIKLGFWRPIIIILSILFMTFAPWILKSYRHLRYTWLGWHGQPLPAALRRHPLLWIRLTGVVLFVGSLLFI